LGWCWRRCGCWRRRWWCHWRRRRRRRRCDRFGRLGSWRCRTRCFRPERLLYRWRSRRWLGRRGIGCRGRYGSAPRGLRLPPDRKHCAAHGAPGSDPGFRYFGGIDSIDAGAVGTGDVHLMILEAVPWSSARAGLPRPHAGGLPQLPSPARFWRSFSVRWQARLPGPDAQIVGADW
jgi:hypothetical protein